MIQTSRLCFGMSPLTVFTEAREPRCTDTIVFDAFIEIVALRSCDFPFAAFGIVHIFAAHCLAYPIC